MIPDWLPALCSTQGEWGEILARLYAVFQRDFVANPPRIAGSFVWWQRKLVDGFEEAFWHIITRDDAPAGMRLFDPRRAERLPWCAPIFSHCADPAVKMWRYRDSPNQISLYLWLEAGDYVIVLRERDVKFGLIYFLVTAHHVDGEQTRRKLQRRYQQKLA